MPDKVMKHTLSRMLLLLGMLLIACLILSEVRESRAAIVQHDDRLTPIQREIQRQQQRLVYCCVDSPLELSAAGSAPFAPVVWASAAF